MKNNNVVASNMGRSLLIGNAYIASTCIDYAHIRGHSYNIASVNCISVICGFLYIILGLEILEKEKNVLPNLETKGKI